MNYSNFVAPFILGWMLLSHAVSAEEALCQCKDCKCSKEHPCNCTQGLECNCSEGCECMAMKKID